MSGIEWEVPEDQPFSERTWAEASGRSYEFTGDQKRQRVLQRIKSRLEKLPLGEEGVSIRVSVGDRHENIPVDWFRMIERDIERALEAE